MIEAVFCNHCRTIKRDSYIDSWTVCRICTRQVCDRSSCVFTGEGNAHLCFECYLRLPAIVARVRSKSCGFCSLPRCSPACRVGCHFEYNYRHRQIVCAPRSKRAHTPSECPRLYSVSGSQPKIPNLVPFAWWPQAFCCFHFLLLQMHASYVLPVAGCLIWLLFFLGTIA